jgi:hypothetical protein
MEPQIRCARTRDSVNIEGGAEPVRAYAVRKDGG